MRPAHVVPDIHVDTLGGEVLEAVELALSSRIHEGRAAAAPHAVSGGGEGGAAGAAGGEGGGRGADGCGGGWRGGAHLVCGIHVHPHLDEALEGGEVAIPRRLAKSLLRLRAQLSALSASQEQGGEARACMGRRIPLAEWAPTPSWLRRAPYCNSFEWTDVETATEALQPVPFTSGGGCYCT
eukprot:scaffold75167_cov56-Phaeocystis_antarctica.AAC.2